MLTSQSFPGTPAPSISSAPQQPDEARETSLSAQRVTLLYEALPGTLVAGGGCALALAFVNWNILPHSGLLAWLAFQLLLAVGRYGLARAFQVKSSAPGSVLRWDRAFVIGTALAGLGWGPFP